MKPSSDTLRVAKLMGAAIRRDRNRFKPEYAPPRWRFFISWGINKLNGLTNVQKG